MVEEKKLSHHETLCVWCDAYRDGYRITWKAGQFIFHAVDWLRIMKTKKFGLIEMTETAPSESVRYLTERARDELTTLLSPPVPQVLESLFWHPLSLDYEARPLATMAARLGMAVYLEPCRMGIFPRPLPNESVGKPALLSLPELAPILQKNGYSYFRESYQGLG